MPFGESIKLADCMRQVPRDCPEDIVDLIHECTQQNPTLRPDMKQCFDRIKARLGAVLRVSKAGFCTQSLCQHPSP